MTTGSLERVELRTARLVLRPFRLKDVDEVYSYAKDPEWGRSLLMPVPEPYVRRDAEEFIAKAVLASQDINPMFAIVLDTRVVGGIHLEINITDQVADLGYGIATTNWGKGLATEAATAVLDWAFIHYDLQKICARADLHNRRSIRVMEKLGMKREGVLRSHRKGRTQRIDVVYYGILRTEWEKRAEAES